MNVFFIFAGERTIPVDIFLMIDKSLSMEEPGKFDSLQKWVLDDLIGQMLIKDDWITIYQFYEKPEHLLTLNISDNNSKQQVYNTVKNIKPNGPYTDIGYALETVQKALDERGSNGRFKVLLLLSDLIQDAPWTSKYRGKQDSFQSPYLVEARIIKHDNWYEITLDMDIQDAVVQRTQSLYSDVVANEGLPREKSSQNEALVKGDTKVVTTGNAGSSDSGTGVGTTGTNETDSNGIADITDSDSVSGSDTNLGSSNLGTGVDTTSSSETGSSGVADTTGSDSVSGSDTNSGSSNSGTGIDTTGTNETSTDGNNLVARKTEAKKTSDKNLVKSFFAKHSTLVFIILGALILLILLIVFIMYLIRKNNRKKEAEKEKIDLV